MNVNAPTFVPLSDAKSPSGDHTQDIKHHGKPTAERQPHKKHHNKPRSNHGKGNRPQQHHHNARRSEKTPTKTSNNVSRQEDSSLLTVSLNF
jgi:hypothetical protein